jgi:hypothetical protein
MPNPKIGLTSFIDYFIAQSPTKVSKVRAARRMMAGEGFDHWLMFRRAAIDSLVAGGDKAVIRACVSAAGGTRAAQTYSECGNSLIRWIGRKSITAAALPTGRIWSGPGLDVSVNPELRISIDTRPEMHLKLYFKAEPLSKRAADPMLRLIEQKYGRRTPAAILDVRRRRLHSGPVGNSTDLDLLLQAEARSFATIWVGL